VSWDNSRQSVLGLSWHFIASALHLRDCSWSSQLKSTSDSVTSRIRRKCSVMGEVDICYRLACVDKFTRWQKLRNGAGLFAFLWPIVQVLNLYHQRYRCGVVEGRQEQGIGSKVN